MAYQNFSPRKVKSRGPINAQVMVVGEAPGKEEDEQLLPFVGQSGKELERMLSEARFISSGCRYTNVLKYKPWDNEVALAFASSKKRAMELSAPMVQGRYCLPQAVEGIQELYEEIRTVKPKVIIALGGTALWATTGKEGIEDWRSSELPCIFDDKIPVVPTYHPAAILRVWGDRYLVIHDLKRANRVLTQGGFTPAPAWHFRIRPSFEETMECLDICEKSPELAIDIETKRLHIACMALAWDELNAICIPFFNSDGSPFWSEEQELMIVFRIQKILSSHKIIGQNFHYDAQYFSRRMLVQSECSFDTQIAQHVLLPGTPKSLAHNSSLYCPYHVFWKDDGKEWDPKIHPPEQLWTYNCVDAVKTFEVKKSQQFLLEKYKLQEQMAFQMRLWPKVLDTMLKGVAVDNTAKILAGEELGKAIEARQQWLNIVVGRKFNPRSPKQMAEFLIDELGVKGRKGKKTKGKVSFGKQNLKVVSDEHVLLWPFIQTIEEIRSLGIFKSNFAEAPLDVDGRMRCTYKQTGAETFRFASAESAFFIGTNLQNIPKGDRSTTLEMPNMRKLFLPDPGMEIGEVDLAGADAQVVAWECDDAILKEAFRRGFKIHAVNAKDLFGGNAGPDGKKEPYYTWAKQGVHLTNYLGTAPTLAKTLGITTKEAEKFQNRWFQIHPNIPKWHERVRHAIYNEKTIYNRFGFRRVYFDRPDGIMAQAVAWAPQSTVAIVINWAFIKIGEASNLPVEVLLQVHDSLVFQYPKELRDEVLIKLHPLLLTPVPYPDPLTIQLGLKISDKSWGAIEDYKWPG
jgi:DNA polymerase I-like protein with 3'-5' exonuclease and polymerase domains/uracil-DNA glycosylase